MSLTATLCCTWHGRAAAHTRILQGTAAVCLGTHPSPGHPQIPPHPSVEGLRRKCGAFWAPGGGTFVRCSDHKLVLHTSTNLDLVITQRHKSSYRDRYNLEMEGWKNGCYFKRHFVLFHGLTFKLFHSLAGREVSTPLALAKASLCPAFPLLSFPTYFLYFPLCGTVLSLKTGLFPSF